VGKRALATGARAAAAAAAAAAHAALLQAEILADTPADAGCLHRGAGILQSRDCGIGLTGVHTGVQVRPILEPRFLFICTCHPARVRLFVSRGAAGTCGCRR